MKIACLFTLKGKTEFVLYGSHQKLSKQPNVKISHNQTIHETKSKKYFTEDLDSHLSVHQYFENVYKKESARVKFLSRIRKKVSPYIAESIYKTIQYSFPYSKEQETNHSIYKIELSELSVQEQR